jgi:ubiquinone/menaquinone biosynthesis C-methylase UbiE
MFTKSAEIYDLVYSFKDYQKESEEIKRMLLSKRAAVKSILDIGCGTAEHHKYLKGDFDIDGIDLNEKFISIAQQKNPHGTYTVANMTSFDLNKKYDAIICLFSSIGYLKTINEIEDALQSFSRHLNDKGIVIIEPWFTPKTYSGSHIGITPYDGNDIKICRVTHGHVENNFSILNFQYLLATVKEGIRHFEERHELRLTTKEEMLGAFNTAGFHAEFEERGLIGRGMYFGEKKNIPAC